MTVTRRSKLSPATKKFVPLANNFIIALFKDNECH